MNHQRIGAALKAASAAGRVGLVPFITAGYPEKDQFIDTLRRVATIGDVIEVGVPYSDPMADGVTIQRASHHAIEHGVSLRWILEELRAAGDPGAPVVLMSYLNPLLVYGFDQLSRHAAQAGVCGFIVPDLPLEESADFRGALDAQGLGLIQLVTPATPPARTAELCSASRGFVYAVTMTGITGGAVALPPEVTAYLDLVRSIAEIPVCAGFGIRQASQVEALRAHTDGVIVGSALVERLEAGEDPADFLRSLITAQ